jgi:ATP-binding cassette, subfamily B, bacterial MsbA
LDFFTRSTTGDLLTRINGDTAQLLRCLKLGAADLVKESISLISILGMLFLFNWKLTLFGMIFVPFCLFPLLVLAKKARKASRAGVGSEVMLTSQLVELLSSIRIIKAYLLEKERLNRYQEISKHMIRQGMRNLKAKELVTPLIEVISMFGIGVVIIFIFKTQTSISDFVGFLTGMFLFFVPIKKLASVHILFEQATPGVQRLINILDVQPTVKEAVNPKPLRGFRSAITFENVSFAYEDRTVIHNLNLVIPYGARIGLAGPSGTGKSTLVNLLFRFYDPTQGSIRIDGIDLRDVTFQDLRQLMALVSQEVVLFDQTAAENIACGRPGATRQEVEAAARAAYAHDFIMQLPKNYDTRLGERGVKLSMGQRQRISIARAFIRNSPILVFDEATASLDSEAEAEVQRAIDHISENRTVISVAHRLSTLATSHQIIVLAEGRIIEQGGFEDLLQAGGTFAVMARRQGIFPNRSILGMVKQA